MRLLTPSGWLRRETLSDEGENSDLRPPGRPDIVHLTVLDRDFFVIKASADEFYISSFCLAFFSRCARLMISAITTCERCYASTIVSSSDNCNLSNNGRESERGNEAGNSFSFQSAAIEKREKLFCCSSDNNACARVERKSCSFP
jgi:hypothetical protein